MKHQADYQIDRFYDPKSVTITLDLSMVNYELGSFSTIILEVHQYQSGLSHLYFKQYFIDASIYNDDIQYFRITFDGVFILVVITNMIFFIRYFMGKVNDDIEREKKK